MDETRARFLTAIATQLPVERVAEVHLFPAIRQGGMESGVAVLALDQAIVASEDPSEPIAEPAPNDAPDHALDDAPDGAPDDGPDILDGEPDDTPDDMPDDMPDDTPDDVRNHGLAPAPRRYTVYTARYRHTLKGLERGKWEVSVTEEADAPLLTVDAVVRGVQRRSGDVDDIVRLTGDEMRAAIVAPVARIA